MRATIFVGPGEDGAVRQRLNSAVLVSDEVNLIVVAGPPFVYDPIVAEYGGTVRAATLGLNFEREDGSFGMPHQIEAIDGPVPWGDDMYAVGGTTYFHFAPEPSRELRDPYVSLTDSLLNEWARDEDEYRTRLYALATETLSIAPHDCGDRAWRRFLGASIARATRSQDLVLVDRTALGLSRSEGVDDLADERRIQTGITPHVPRSRNDRGGGNPHRRLLPGPAENELFAITPQGAVARGLRLAHNYVARAYPSVGGMAAEEVLEWKGSTSGSRLAFRNLVTRLALDAGAISDGKELAEYLQFAVWKLDLEYSSLVSEVKGNTLWAAAKRRSPVIVGAATTGAVSAGASIALGLSSPLLAAAAGAITVGQVVAVLGQKLQRSRELRKEPLYWLYSPQ